MTIQQKLDSFTMVLADNIRANDQIIKQFEQLQEEIKELQQQPVTTNWYDFTDEQKEHLGEIVDDFISSLIRNMRSMDIDLNENGINVNITLDLQDLIEDALPYGISDKFQEHLEEQINSKNSNNNENQ